MKMRGVNVVAVIAACLPTVFAYPGNQAKIPNGSMNGKSTGVGGSKQQQP
jgi:hypothetical protein